MTQVECLTAVDLFSGAGGTGIGFIEAGYQILAALDNDPHAAKTYGLNLGIDVLEADIREVAPEWLRKQLQLPRRKLGVLAGCPPCQGFSRIRNSAGATDERNKLVLTYLAFVREFEPKFALFENVPGLRRSLHGKLFYEQLIAGLIKLGYHPQEHLLDAADYGVPQHRKRVIVVAGRDGVRPPPILATHGAPGSHEVRRGIRKPWATVRDAIGKYPALGPGESDSSVPNHVAGRTGQSAKGGRILEFIRHVPPDGGSRRDLPRNQWLPCHKRINGFTDVYGRSAWDAPSNTITGGCTNPSKGRFLHPEQHRGLSYREAAALQSFPDSFVFYGDRIASQIGNAVPPLLAKAIASSLIPLLESEAWPPADRVNSAEHELDLFD